MAKTDPHSPFRIEDPQPLEDDNYDGPDYTGMGAEGLGTAASGIMRRYGLLIGLVILGICVLLVLLVAFPKKPPVDTARLDSLTARIDQLQKQIDQLATDYGELAELKIQGKRAEQLLGRMDQLEKTTAQRMEELSQKLIAMEKQGLQPKPPPTAPKPPAAKPPATKPPAKTSTKKATKSPSSKPAAPTPAVKYHTVQAGETLYRISRKYGITVDTLIQINKLSGTNINTGDKLRVSK